ADRADRRRPRGGLRAASTPEPTGRPHRAAPRGGRVAAARAVLHRLRPLPRGHPPRGRRGRDGRRPRRTPPGNGFTGITDCVIYGFTGYETATTRESQKKVVPVGTPK